MFVVSSYLLSQPTFNIKYDDDNDDVDDDDGDDDDGDDDDGGDGDGDDDDDDDDDDVQERKTRLISCVPVLDKT